MESKIDDLTGTIRQHPCYTHPVFDHWALAKPSVREMGALFHHIGQLCEASRLPHEFGEGLDLLDHSEARETLRRIALSEEDHGPQLACMVGHIINKVAHEQVFTDLKDQRGIEQWAKDCSSYYLGRLPGYDTSSGTTVHDRAIAKVFARRKLTDRESTYKNVGTLLAIEMLANNQIIPGEYHCLIHSGAYPLDIKAPELEYLREHGGEDGGAEEWHEREAIKAVSGLLNEETSALILQGAMECLDAINGLFDLLDSALCVPVKALN